MRFQRNKRSRGKLGLTPELHALYTSYHTLSTKQRMDEKNVIANLGSPSSVLQASASTDFLKISELLFIKTNKTQEARKKNQEKPTSTSVSN